MNKIVATAREWIGTPYVHQASCKGAGSDCLGLLRGVWRDVIGDEPEQVPAYSMDWSEPQGEERLWQAALRHLKPKHKQDAAPGDILLFRMREGSVAKHVGIQADVKTESSERASFIHAYSGHGVVESALGASWERRIVARFALPTEIE
ncbi:C40 family peptidase [Tropicibacter sp. R15_0]|uniref:NlpC/P60 family protein n=1 Tax=Tropicibacter sp. R15_0 TaxID=2821101 RepID=UPI001ADC906A|nr:NlpC/P60 family protein [Tropicibacter sp. R15_0]MBO9464418.1 C40 family peptidase [Tropicibacter sp. R15_0]